MSLPGTHIQPTARLVRAFSLVETALALGIVAFSLTALVALLPGGLTQFREAMNTSIEAQIFQRLVTDAEQAEFDTLFGNADAASHGFFALPTRFFDDQGSEVTAKETGRIVYQARVRVSPPGPPVVQHETQEFTSLPAGGGEARFAPRDAVFLTVQVAHYPVGKELVVGPDALWLQSGAQSALRVSTYSAVVTRNGHATPPVK